MRKLVNTAATTVTEEKAKDERMVNDVKCLLPPSVRLDRNIEFVTDDLCNQQELSNDLHRILPENALIISEYIIAMKTEINPSDNYRGGNIRILYMFSKYHQNKLFKTMTREDIISFLDSYRRPDAADPLHKWIGTYNLFRTYLLRFFKWLYYPDIEPNKRPKPAIIENILQLKRKEISIYKPADLWTAEDNLLFLKYCPSERLRCFHAISCDTGCRPHELLKLRIRDIAFKNAGNKQYAEVLVNGKTGSRHIPLIDSIPYLKDYLGHEHPQPGNPSSILICGIGKSLARPLNTQAIDQIYGRLKYVFFTKLLRDPNVIPEDKQKISELLKKPWNPYIIRHSALTEKSKILKEHVLRQHAGWSPRSQMHLRYLHYYGNESSESILEAYGILTKDQKLSDTLRPKQCPNCNEPNKPDGKFCARCRMILSYDAYEDTVNNKQERDDAISILSDQVMKLMAEVQELKKTQ
ncbi:MAG TPA: site-specific integrase [Nitrososphaeraceae archaeon]